MELVEFKDGKPVVSLDAADSLFLHNSLVEALYGIGDREFAARAGVTQEEAEAFLKLFGGLGKEDGGGGATLRLVSTDGANSVVQLDIRDLRLFKEAIEVTLREIEDWELHARTGTNPEDARAIRDGVSRILKELTGG